MQTPEPLTRQTFTVNCLLGGFVERSGVLRPGDQGGSRPRILCGNGENGGPSRGTFRTSPCGEAEVIETSVGLYAPRAVTSKLLRRLISAGAVLEQPISTSVASAKEGSATVACWLATQTLNVCL